MELINKLNVLMKTSLAGITVNDEADRVTFLTHYLAQCLYKQCDMYELREMCRLKGAHVKKNANKQQTIECLMEHLPELSPVMKKQPQKESLQRQQKPATRAAVKKQRKKPKAQPIIKDKSPLFPAVHDTRKRRKLGPTMAQAKETNYLTPPPLTPDSPLTKSSPISTTTKGHSYPITPPKMSLVDAVSAMSGEAKTVLPGLPPMLSLMPSTPPDVDAIPLETPPDSPGETVDVENEIVVGAEEEEEDGEAKSGSDSHFVTPPMMDHEYCLSPALKMSNPEDNQRESGKTSPSLCFLTLSSPFSVKSLSPSPTPGLLGAARRAITAGLRNRGLYCYMNSIIQCLANIPLLKRWLLRAAFKASKPASSSALIPLVAEFQKLVSLLWETPLPFIDPNMFIEALYTFAFPFPKNKQQDSSEFLVWFLNALHQDLSPVKKERDRKSPAILKTSQVVDGNNNKGDKLSKQHWESTLLKNGRSVITDLFSGQSRSTVECLTCGTMSFTFEQFQCLALPIPESSTNHPVTVQECFTAYLCKEIVGSGGIPGEDSSGPSLDGVSSSLSLSPSCKWRCPKCKVPRHFSKKIDLLRLPDVLVISLNRFHSSSDRPKKVNDLVNFSLNGLDLSFTTPQPLSTSRRRPSTSKPLVYDLWCVSNHCGSLSRGHYTASCRSRCDGGGDISGDSWFSFNDCIVSPLRDFDVVSSEAYVLFYVRRQ